MTEDNTGKSADKPGATSDLAYSYQGRAQDWGVSKMKYCDDSSGDTDIF